MEESGTKLHTPLVLNHFVLFPQKLSECGRVFLSLRQTSCYMKSTKQDIKRMQWENDPLYRLIRTIKNVMDRYYLDPLIGLLFPTAGDIFSSAMTLPFLTVSLFKIKSIPLTLAILYNMLVDMMLGIIPLWIGDLLDIFSRSYAKNYRLIVGFVEGDKEVIQEVNRKALLTAVGILVLCVIIYWVAKLAVYLTTALWTWISGLF